MTTRLAGLAALILAGIVGIYFAGRAGGTTAAALAAVAVGCAGALILRGERADSAAMPAEAILDNVLLALPAALVIYLSIDKGGYFPTGPAVAAVLLVVAMVLRITLVEEPLLGSSWPLALAAASLALLALWTLLSATWSDAPGRALVEFDRTFAYLLLLVLVGTVARTSSRLRWLAASLALASVVVAVIALATRLAPDRFSTSIPAIGESNLAYPLTYSNALGILCVLGGILSLYFASSARLPAVVRALGAAALPLLSVTVYLTLSRGPVAAAIVGVVAFLLLGRPRGALSAALAVVPASAIAVASAYQHPLITSRDPTSSAAAAQGHRVAIVVIGCVLGAAALRLVLVPLDRRLRTYSLPERSRRPVLTAAWAGIVLLAVAVAIAADAPTRISDQYHRFVDSGQAAPQQQDIRQSLFSSANRGIVDNWSVALDGFRDQPLRGQGAGTYENWWNENRPAHQHAYNVTDAHSLYLEMLGEQGIVGFLLLMITLGTILIALLPFRRGPHRALYAALFSTALAWTIHAGVDWDWEMPAVTVIFFAIGGAAVAAHAHSVRPVLLSPQVRVAAGLVLLAAVITPALVFASQRQLNDARDGLRAGDCPRAIDRAADAINSLSVRSEPYEVLALCQQKRGRAGFAVDAMRQAVKHDPNNWRYHYELGILLGATGGQARPEIERAHELNPYEPSISRVLVELPKGQAVNWDIELLGPTGAILNKP
jgi:O-antigen ligase